MLPILDTGPLYDAVFPITRIHRTRNQGVEMGVVPLIITPTDSLAKFLLPIPVTLYFAVLEFLASKEVMLPPGDTTIILLNWKLRLPPSHFGLCMPLNQ